MFERVAVVDEDEFLLVRIAPQEVDQRRLLAAGADRGDALRQRLPGCIDVAAGEAPHRPGRRGRRRAGSAEQVLQREPVCTLGRQAAGRGGKLVVDGPLGFGAVDPDRRGMPARQFQRDDGARVAHHGAAHQLAQALGIGRLVRLAGRYIGGAELLRRLEDARLEQGEDVVQFGEVVLHRRRRQQEQEALVERVHQPVALARAVA